MIDIAKVATAHGLPMCSDGLAIDFAGGREPRSRTSEVLTVSTLQRQATVERLDQIGDWILVAAAWKHLDTRRTIYELAHLAQIVVRCHNELAEPVDQISFDDAEAIWIVEIMSALREFRPTAFSPENEA